MKGLTLAEALATGKAFRRMDWEKSLYMAKGMSFVASVSEFYEPVWEVYEEPKKEPEPPLRVLRCAFQGDFRVSRLKLSTDEDITEKLAAALAPYLRDEG